jgi:tRNA-dihydrouridine synthase B
MINAEAIVRDNKYALRFAQSCAKDRPLGVQLFGAKPSSMREAARILCRQPEFDFFDLNLGCPQPNIVKQGAGAALLKRPQRAAELLAGLKEAGLPVSAKIRLNPNVLNTIKFCKALEKAGADCITVHAKTIKQGFGGKADFVSLKRLVKAVGVPVIANGNLSTKHDFEKTIEETKAAAAMVGRAATGNPGVFAELRGEKGITPIAALSEYLSLCREHGAPRFGRQKTQAIRFLTAAKEKSASQAAQRAKSVEELEVVLAGLGNQRQGLLHN